MKGDPKAVRPTSSRQVGTRLSAAAYAGIAAAADITHNGQPNALLRDALEAVFASGEGELNPETLRAAFLAAADDRDPHRPLGEAFVALGRAADSLHDITRKDPGSADLAREVAAAREILESCALAVVEYVGRTLPPLPDASAAEVAAENEGGEDIVGPAPPGA